MPLPESLAAYVNRMSPGKELSLLPLTDTDKLKSCHLVFSLDTDTYNSLMDGGPDGLPVSVGLGSRTSDFRS